jgi:hypothetical protein
LNCDLRERELVYLSVVFFLIPFLLLLLLHFLLCSEGIAVLNLVPRFSSLHCFVFSQYSKSRLFIQRDCVNGILEICVICTQIFAV